MYYTCSVHSISSTERCCALNMSMIIRPGHVAPAEVPPAAEQVRYRAWVFGDEGPAPRAVEPGPRAEVLAEVLRRRDADSDKNVSSHRLKRQEQSI